MIRRMKLTVSFFILAFAALALTPKTPLGSSPVAAEDLSGYEILRFARIALGGKEYEGLKQVTAKSEGFVNVAPFGAAGLGTGPSAGAVEFKLKLVDYQDKELKRRLDVQPTSPAMAVAPTYLVYTGTQGGGMYQGNEFRVSESAASRQWAMMGFSALNKASDGQIPVSRVKDEMLDGVKHYVVEVKFTSDDVVRFWINQKDLFISKVVTRYKSQVLVEETRSDYKKVGCMYLPFRIITKLQGQKLADLNIESYDVETEVPTSKFTLTATP